VSEAPGPIERMSTPSRSYPRTRGAIRRQLIADEAEKARGGDGGGGGDNDIATSDKKTRPMSLPPSPPHISSATSYTSTPSTRRRSSVSPISASSSTERKTSKKRRGSSSKNQHDESTKDASRVAAYRKEKSDVEETKRMGTESGTLSQRRRESDAEREQTLLKVVGPSVLAELPAHMNVHERIALLGSIVQWEDEPLHIEDARVDEKDISAAEMRQWQRLVRTYLRTLGVEQLRDLVFSNPEVLGDVSQVYYANYRVQPPNKWASSHPAPPLVRDTLSQRELLVMLIVAGETRTKTRAYLLAQHPEIPLLPFATPPRTQLPPAPTSLMEVFHALPDGLLRLRKGGPVEKAAIAYLAGVWITTPHQYAKAPARIVTQLGVVIDAKTKSNQPPGSVAPEPIGQVVAQEARVYARYTLRMPLDASERILSRALWQFERERESAYDLELGAWEQWLQPGAPISVLIEWKALNGYGPHKLRYATTLQYYDPLRPRDPVVTLSQFSNQVKLVVQAHVISYTRAGLFGPTVFVLIDDDQFPWLQGHRLPNELQKTLELRVGPSDLCRVHARSDDGDIKTTYKRAEGGAIRWRTREFDLGAIVNQSASDYDSKMACLQPPAGMIAALVLSHGQRGQSLQLKRRIHGSFTNHLNTLVLTPLYVEARVIETGVHPVGGERSHSVSYLRVWADGHVVELRAQYRPPDDGCRSCAVDILEGHRYELFGLETHQRIGGLYVVAYDAPIVPSVRAHLERIREDIPEPLQGVRDITDLVTQMVHS
jgi:hypothetical protein